MTLIDQWKKAWRLSSVQIALIIAVIGALQAGLPDIGLPESTYAVLNTVLAIALAVARIVAQPAVTTTPEQKDTPE